MTQFPRYRLDTENPEDTTVSVRLATAGDRDAITEISETGSSQDEVDPLIGTSWTIAGQEAAVPTTVVFVAEVGRQVAGIARAGYFVPPADAPDNCVPEGWYLQGVIVKPEHRGRGVGSFLTQSRLEWLEDHTDTIRYFVSSRNKFSIDVHKQLGFREVRRDVWAPKTVFSEGGTGILYELPVARRRSAGQGTPVTVRLARPDDAEAIRQLSAEGESLDEIDPLSGPASDLGRSNTGEPRMVLFVAEVERQVAGFARAGYFVPPADAPDNCVPEGWYLQGVIVRPEYRGRGIGSFLTESRLDWLAGHTGSVRYFVSSRNKNSIELHKQLGFRETRRDVWAPKTIFAGDGAGVLYELGLDRRPSIQQRIPI